MKPFNLEEYQKNPSRKVVTRDGQSVKIHCTNFDYISGQLIVAEIKGSGYSTTFFKNGKFFKSEETPLDLFFTPEKHEGWINIYKNVGSGEPFCGGIYDSKAEAKSKSNNMLATIKIEWEE